MPEIHVRFENGIELSGENIKKIVIEYPAARIYTCNVIRGTFSEEKTYTVPLDKLHLSINPERQKEVD